MTNAPDQKAEGVAVKQPGSCNHGTAPRRQDASPRTLHVEVGPRYTSWCYGGRIRPLLKRVGVPTMYDRQRKAWAVPTDRLDDVLVVAEHTEKRFVTVQAVTR
ncbi:MAG: hypothetical protein M3P48_05185 [Actinomycetota bacterium]|nr:hypothetical protein [Actinomycetota bacterium]